MTSPISLPLQLVPTETSQRETVAWYLPEPHPERWLDQLAAWRMPLESVTFLPLGRQHSERDKSNLSQHEITGVLVLCRGVDFTSTKAPRNHLTHNAQASDSEPPLLTIPYGCEADRFYVPVEAAFSPAVHLQDFDRLLADDDSVYVWHPVEGLVRFERRDQLKGLDLLKAPCDESDSDSRFPSSNEGARSATVLNAPAQSIVLSHRGAIRWDRAVAGTAFPSRLISVAAEEQLSIEELLRDAGGDIGTERNALNRLPPLPTEWLAKWWQRAMKPLHSGWQRMIAWLAERWPRWHRRQKRDEASSQTSKQPSNQGVMPNWLASILFPFAFLAQAVSLLLSFLLSILPLPRLNFGPIPAGRWMSGGGLGFGDSLLGDWPQWAMKWFGALSMFGATLSVWQAKHVPWGRVNQRQRNREIDRLLNMLKVDPDTGLRYALPMGGQGAQRGVASPSNWLMPRNLNFNLGGLFGVGPVDMWMVPVEQQMQLITMYRELAAREIRFGRHRRAAYIFAQLLGDLRGAAGALEQGLHFREAAALYREKLKSPLEAAKCLERGGLLEEAASLYVEHGQIEPAAELYLRLGHVDRARDLFRIRVDELLRQSDYRGAARIVEFKLNEVDEALNLLGRGWPDSATAQGCLTDQFAMLGRHSRHSDAMARIATLRSSTLSIHATKLLARVLSGISKDYPDERARTEAADATITVVSRRLPGATAIETNDLLVSIQSLAPQDRLLNRDCERFSRERASATRKPLLASLRPKTSSISLVRSFVLYDEKTEPHVSWRVAKATDNAVFVAGIVSGRDELVLRHFHWENVADLSMTSRWMLFDQPGLELFLELDPYNKDFVALHASNRVLKKNELTVTEPNGFRRRLFVGSPNWADPSTLGFVATKGGYWWHLRSSAGLFELESYSPKESLQTTTHFIPPLPEIESEFDGNTTLMSSPSLQFHQCLLRHIPTIGAIAVSGRMLFHPAPENQGIKQVPKTLALELAQPVRNLVVMADTRINEHSWMLATFDHGAKLIPYAFLDYRSFDLAEDLEQPISAAFLPGNRLAIAGSIGPQGSPNEKHEVRVYQLDRDRATEMTRIPLPSASFAITGTNQLTEFAVFGIDETCRIFRIKT